MDTIPASDSYDELVHYDVRFGNKTSLKSYLKHKPEYINKLYQYGESKWTVLLAACYYQHEEIVEMLINEFKADVKAEGTIVMNHTNNSKRIYHDVSPLWAAVFVNNFNIVKFLVQYVPATVNHLTKERRSPFRIACYNGNLEMVQLLIQYGANPHRVESNSPTNLMLAVYHQHTDLVTYLVDDVKCDLNEQNGTGRTALHIAVEHDFFEIAKFLISRGALNIRDLSDDMTPLMWAAVRGKTEYVNAFDGYCSDIEWIEARELLAAAYAGCRPIIENLDLAEQHLTLAFEARATKNIPKQCTEQTLEIFNNSRECQTLEDLNQLISSGSREALYIEALLIQRRLFGTNSKTYRRSVQRVGYIFSRTNQYNICLRLWLYALDLRRQQKNSLNKQFLRLFTTVFHRILLRDKSQISINEVCKLLRIMTEELSVLEDAKTFNYNLVTLLQLLTISAQSLFNEGIPNDHKLSIEDGKVLIQHIRSIVAKNYVTHGSGSSLLHLCCNEKTIPFSRLKRYPCLMTVRLLVFCGIDVNAIDSTNKTVLHILVQNLPSIKSMAIIDFLCNTTDVHVDFADNNGNTPMDYSDSILNNRHARVKRLQQKKGVTSLKCHCARLAKYAKLPYEECLSSALVKFVQRH